MCRQSISVAAMRGLGFLLLLIGALAATGQARAEDKNGKPGRFQFTQVEMGSPFRIVLYAPSEGLANSAAKAAFDRIGRLNDILSDYDADSELSRLSATAGSGKKVPVSPDLWNVLARAQQISEQSQGAFDVTIGPVVKLWRRARRNGKMPSQERLDQARSAVGFRHLQLIENGRLVELKLPGMRLDLGGIAKGYAADEALRVLGEQGIQRALVDASGDIAVGAPPPDEQGWRIGIAPLDAKAPPSRTIRLNGRAIATSGDAWQHVEIDGRRYSHIVDPRTGLGLTDRSSVTVIAADCITADALASAVSVLGSKQGLALIDKAPGAAALIVRNVDGQPEIHRSQRWKEFATDETPAQ